MVSYDKAVRLLLLKVVKVALSSDTLWGLSTVHVFW